MVEVADLLFVLIIASMILFIGYYLCMISNPPQLVLDIISKFSPNWSCSPTASSNPHRSATVVPVSSNPHKSSNSQILSSPSSNTPIPSPPIPSSSPLPSASPSDFQNCLGIGKCAGLPRQAAMCTDDTRTNTVGSICYNTLDIAKIEEPHCRNQGGQVCAFHSI